MTETRFNLCPSVLLFVFALLFLTSFNVLAPVVQTLDSDIHRINNYPADNAIVSCNTYPLDRDLSDG